MSAAKTGQLPVENGSGASSAGAVSPLETAQAPEVAALVRQMAGKARLAARSLAVLSGAARNTALLKIADGLIENKTRILSENLKDLELARRDGLEPALVGRLTLTAAKLDLMAKSVREIAAQVDPVGQTMKAYDRPNGLRIEKRRVPIGVIAIIFESRPNVTSDAAALCLKSGNACILRGGKEAMHSNLAVAKVIRAALETSHVDANAVQIIETSDRAAVGALVTAEGLVDLAIPRGGEGLIRAVVEQATIPVIKHYKGVCHIYIDRAADMEMAVNVAHSAKVHGAAYCNTAECLLVHKDIAADMLPRLAEKYRASKVEMRADAAALALMPGAKPAAENDWGMEFLDLIIAVKIVGSMEEAIDHIAHYGSQHTDAIITQDIAAANRFVQLVDSSSVMVNASTRWADGFEYGLGAEIGISTDKLHARGPMGAADLCTYKYVVTGTGHVRN